MMPLADSTQDQMLLQEVFSKRAAGSFVPSELKLPESRFPLTHFAV